MKPTQRTLRRLVTVVGFVLLVFCALRVWQKYDSCQAWANHYAARAIQLRADAANPELGLAEIKERLIAADLHDLISRKYSKAAWRPWHPYPDYPLVTPEEQRLVSEKH